LNDQPSICIVLCMCCSEAHKRYIHFSRYGIFVAVTDMSKVPIGFQRISTITSLCTGMYTAVHRTQIIRSIVLNNCVQREVPSVINIVAVNECRCLLYFLIHLYVIDDVAYLGQYPRDHFVDSMQICG